MLKKGSISFVVPVNDDHVYENNIMASPIFKNNNNYQIIKQTGFVSASKAYNDGINQSENEIIVFAHQDIVFPDFWENELTRALVFLEENDPDWGVIGCYGHDMHGDGFGFMYCAGNDKLLGRFSAHPIQVQTLDEVVLIIKKSSGLRFDDSMPYFHLYGADICMTAASSGKKCYAISAFCLHNTNLLPFLPNDFFVCYEYVKTKWFHLLPIDTTCIRIERDWNKQYINRKYIWRLRSKWKGLFRGYKVDRFRSEEPIALLHKLKTENILYCEE
jgi:hypothetical protein